jgi:hypothetical protein
VHLWCGNAALIVPRDLEGSELRARFFAEKRPRYLLVEDEPRYAWPAGDPALRERLRSGRFVLYEREGAPPPPPWRAPPPPACAGRADDCVLRLAPPAE